MGHSARHFSVSRRYSLIRRIFLCGARCLLHIGALQTHAGAVSVELHYGFLSSFRMSVQPQTNLPIAWNLQPLIPHSGTLPGRRYAICPRWCHTAFGARYQNRTGTYCLEGSRSAINLIRHTPARRRASRKEEVEKGGYESAQSVVNSTLCVHFTAILIVRSTFKWRNENFFTFSQ